MRRRQFISHLGGAALAPLIASRVYADPPGGCGVPGARDDGWPVATVNEDKLIDRDALCRMADRLAASSTANIHAILVAHAGKLVFERYFGGSDEIYSRRVGNVTFDADTLHNMKSVSKSVASLAVEKPAIVLSYDKNFTRLSGSSGNTGSGAVAPAGSHP
jgi:hypothetical protein